MTYLITPSLDAINVDGTEYIMVYDRPEFSTVQINKHSDEWIDISPRFTGEKHKYQALQFMKSYILTMSNKPAIIEISDSGCINTTHT